MKIRLFLSFGALCLIGCGSARAEQSAPEQAALAAIEKYEAALRDEGVIGGAVSVMTGPGEVLTRNFGFSDAGQQHLVTSQTQFHWASVTKVFTSIAAMQLVEHGQLRLDDPVVRYIPEFRAVHSDFGGPETITIEHLLTHSSGLRGASWPWNGDGADERADWQPIEPTEWEQIEAMFPYTDITFAPGSQVSYSNLGILILGEVIHRITGDQIEIQIEKNILRPLGMAHTYFDRTPWRWGGLRTHDYIVGKDGGLIDQGNALDSGVTAANGGLNGTTEDMMLFVRFLIGDPSSYQIISRATLGEMLRPRLAFQKDDRRTISMGLGFFISDERDASGQVFRYFGHAGFQRGNRSAIHIAQDGCCAFVFAANTVKRGSGNPSAGLLRADLADTLFPLLRKEVTK